MNEDDRKIWTAIVMAVVAMVMLPLAALRNDTSTLAELILIVAGALVLWTVAGLIAQVNWVQWTG